MRKNHTYRAYAYLRLSVEDGDQIESDSIKNQRVIVQRYCGGQQEIQIIGEAVDDGYTGTNFNRPGFKKILNLIKVGRLTVLFVKESESFGQRILRKYCGMYSVDPGVGRPFYCD